MLTPHQEECKHSPLCPRGNHIPEFTRQEVWRGATNVRRRCECSLV